MINKKITIFINKFSFVSEIFHIDNDIDCHFKNIINGISGIFAGNYGNKCTFRIFKFQSYKNINDTDKNVLWYTTDN